MILKNLGEDSGGFGFFPDHIDDPVNDDKGENHDDETNNGIKNSIFGFLNFGSITSGSHILNTTDNNEDDGNDAGDTDDGVEDVLDNSWETIFGAIATVGFFDSIGDI